MLSSLLALCLSTGVSDGDIHAVAAGPVSLSEVAGVVAAASRAAERLREAGLATGPVRIVVYESPRAFRALTGEPEAILAAWRRGALHLPVGNATASVLRHELTHAAVFARARGRAPRWLDEGLAVLLERDPSRYGVLRRSPPVASLDGLLAAEEPRPGAYLAASRYAACAVARAGGMGALLDRVAGDPGAAEALAAR
jgi:hypothetical protein